MDEELECQDEEISIIAMADLHIGDARSHYPLYIKELGRIHEDVGMLILLGMFVDAVSVITISTPLLLPTVELLGYSTLWFGIVMGITLEMAVITPPVGLNLYTIKGIAPPEVTLTDIVRGVLPFVALEVLCLAIFIAFPPLCLWLPGTMFH